jgi:SAM-dependent methyltransferase
VVRTAVPVHQNLLYAEPAAAVSARRGDLEMVACPVCGLLFNRAFDLALMSYGVGYDNDQLHSPVFREHVEAMARRAARGGRLAGRRVLEIGCGDGSFLCRLLELGDSATTGIGFDPSYAGPPTAADGRAQFRRRYYRAEPDLEADVAVLRHVIEHVPDPVGLLRDTSAALGASSDPAVWLETPDAGWIMDGGVFWDLFYEHCCLFTPRSLATAAARAGLGRSRTDTVFGNQYLWQEFSPGRPGVEGLAPGQMLERTRAFAVSERRQLERWSRRLDELRPRGLAIWGAGAKGVTFVNLLDPELVRVRCLVDVNPGKQSHYVAGTGHPIVAPDGLADLGVGTVLVLNPNYVREVEAQAREAGQRVQVVAEESAT